MRVYVEHDMTVNHDTSVITLKAGQVVEGPLAVYLVESDCAVTIEQDDRPTADPAPEQSPSEGDEKAASDPGTPPEGGETSDQESHTPGAESPEADQQSAEQPEAAEPTAETGAAE